MASDLTAEFEVSLKDAPFLPVLYSSHHSICSTQVPHFPGSVGSSESEGLPSLPYVCNWVKDRSLIT